MKSLVPWIFRDNLQPSKTLSKQLWSQQDHQASSCSNILYIFPNVSWSRLLKTAEEKLKSVRTVHICLNLLWNRTLKLCLALKTKFSLGLIKWIEIFTQRCKNANVVHSHMATITKAIFTFIWNHWRDNIMLYETTKFYVHYTWTRCLILHLQDASYFIILYNSCRVD